MTISNEKHEIMITLIRNSCRCLYEWAQKANNPKMKWLAENILMRSETIYSGLSSVNVDANEYEDNFEKLVKIKAYIDKLFLDLNEIIEHSDYDYLWDYFSEITNSKVSNKKELKKFEINENYEINGFKVSDYGIENDRLDYATLFALAGNAVWNGEVTERIEHWDFVQKPEGFNDWGDCEIDAWYIVDDDAAQFLQDYTDELLIHSFDFDMFVWAWINRDSNNRPDLGVPNNKTLTNIKLSEMKKIA